MVREESRDSERRWSRLSAGCWSELCWRGRVVGRAEGEGERGVVIDSGVEDCVICAMLSCAYKGC